jgi:hypothetical protein
VKRVPVLVLSLVIGGLALWALLFVVIQLVIWVFGTPGNTW